MSEQTAVPWDVQCHKCGYWLDEGDPAQDCGDHYLCPSCMRVDR